MTTRIDPILRRFAADHKWVADHKAALLKKYGDKWVAVKRRKVIAHATTLDALLRRIPDPPHTCIEFIARKPLEMIL